MMEVISYTYEADHHCIACTVKRYQADGFDNEYGEPMLRSMGGAVDYHGVNLFAHDYEGNPIHAMFSTDEWQEFDEGYLAENPTQYLACGDCHTIIEEYTHEEGG
jgi:hypothetical protein